MADGSLSSRVYDDILGRILSGQMRPGSVFNRRQVAAEMGVSVAPVLEAMLELESEGLIQTLPRRGTRVRLPSVQDIQGQLIVREALECQAARLYCGEPVRRHRARLMRLAEDLDKLPPRTVNQVREEIRFHHYLVSLAQCPPLTQAFERVMKIGLLQVSEAMAGEVSAKDPSSSHIGLIEMLSITDADAAEAAIRAHLSASKSTLDADSDQEPVEDVLPPLPTWLGTD
jgi:DNA-binding GntR family transcriptional regulator